MKLCKMNVTVLIPENERGTLIDIHGGAFAFPPVPYQKKIASIYATAGFRVLFPDYPLLPGHRHPEALELVAELAEKTQDLKVLAGDSAGGFLALQAAMALSTKPALMLLYPVIKPFAVNQSMAEFDDTPMWNSKLNSWMWREYIHSGAVADNSYKGIRKAFVETAEFDPLRDEGREAAEKMMEEGTDVVLSETKGTVHGYDILWKKQFVREMIERRLSFLRSL